MNDLFVILIYIIDLNILKILHISKHYMAENVVINLSSMKAAPSTHISSKEDNSTPLNMSQILSSDNIQDTTPPLENYLAIEKQLADVMDSLTGVKQFITQVQCKVRGLDKLIKKEQKNTVKMTEKKNRGNRKPSGFAKPGPVSDELCAFMKKEKGTHMARTEVTQCIVKYIKDKALVNLENKKIIVPNPELKSLLDVTENDEITYFNLQRLMNRHFVSTQ